MAVRKSKVKVLVVHKGMASGQMEGTIMEHVEKLEAKGYELMSAVTHAMHGGNSGATLHFKKVVGSQSGGNRPFRPGEWSAKCQLTQ